MRKRALLPWAMLSIGSLGCSSSSPSTVDAGGNEAGNPATSGDASGTDAGPTGTPANDAAGTDATMMTTPDTGVTPGADTGSPTEAGSPAIDSSVPVESGTGPDAGSGTVTCGTTPTAFNVGLIGGIEQISVGPDGTVYFSHQPLGARLGRYAPPYTAVEAAWKTVPDANAQILGIALDPKTNIIYAGARVSNKVYKIPLDNSPITSVTIPDGLFNGATLGEDGALYYTNEGPTAAMAPNVYRLGPTDTAPTKVNITPIIHANDLAFGPDGWLYINQWLTPATVTRLQIQNGVEVAHNTFATFPTPNGDGIAFDSAGNCYAMAAALYKVTPAGTITLVPTTATPSSGLEFGAGALSCNDLLFATSAGVARMTVTPGGLNVPWHRH